MVMVGGDGWLVSRQVFADHSLGFNDLVNDGGPVDNVKVESTYHLRVAHFKDNAEQSLVYLLVLKFPLPNEFLLVPALLYAVTISQPFIIPLIRHY